MIIDINQAKIAVADKYKIYVGEQEAYRAARKLLRLFAEVNLFRMDDPEPRLTIKKKFSFLKAAYAIRRGGTSYDFTTQSILRDHYQCSLDRDLYDLYGHRGRKFSIYRNDTQVAWWDKEAVSWFAGDNYRIVADDDADAEILIAFCLIIDNYRSDDHDNDVVHVDIGKIGPQAKKFDPDWKPRTVKSH